MQPDFQFTPVVEQQFEKRDPEEFMPWMRCTQTQYRPGKFLIVRPLRMTPDFRKLTEDQKLKKAQAEAQGKEYWRPDLCVADIACLDPIEPAVDQQGKPMKGFPPGHMWREETVFPGYLNRDFKAAIGGTCIGTLKTEPSGFAQPSIKWVDLAGDPAAVDRAKKFLMAFPDFLIPVAATITAVPQQGWNQQPQGHAAPAAAAPMASGYQQPDPWAQGPSQPVSPAPQGHPNTGMSTVDQLRLLAAQNAQGQPQPQDPPF